MDSETPPDQLPGIAVSTFNNSGLSPLLVPGCGMPLFVEASPADGSRRFTHAHDSQHWPMRATAREIAMLRCMEKITEKPNWHKDIHSDDTTSAWKKEAKQDDWKISDRAWAWCVAELRDKAQRFADTGRTLVLDYGRGVVCKKDLGEELPCLLKKMVDEIVEREPTKGRPRPDGIARIVDPHLAPLVYGQTRVLVDGGAVGREDMDNWYGRGVPVARPKNEKNVEVAGSAYKDAERRRRWAMGTLSPAFQWLPCEVAFNPEVQITSYVNDLHPHRQADAYPALERAIAVAIESWNDVLARVDSIPNWVRLSTGRTPARIKTFGVQYPFGLPAWEKQYREAEELRDLEAMANLVASLQPMGEEVSRGLGGSRTQVYGARGGPDGICWEESRRILHPEPGVSFSYQDWETGRNVTRAIVPQALSSAARKQLEEKPDIREPDVHLAYSGSLKGDFYDAGLQVVVQVNSIELSPGMPRRVDDLDEWEDEMWHAADTLVTDYIAATSLLFFGFDNVHPVGVRFHQPVHLRECDFLEADHDDFRSIMEVFDLDDSANAYWGLCQPRALPAVQEMGQAVATEGRILSFPGPIAYRFKPWELVDASRAGRARYLVVHLVDPNYRVCSTRNVPPQRMDWWAYDLARKAPDALGRLPAELFDEIVAEAADADGMLDAQGMERVRDGMEKERRENADDITEDGIGFHRFCEDWDHIVDD